MLNIRPDEGVIIGLASKSRSLLLAATSYCEGSFVVNTLEDLPTIKNVKQLYTTPTPYVVASPPPEQVMHKRLKIELINDKEIASALPFQLEPLFPQPVENLIFCWEKIFCSENSSTLMIYAIAKDHLENYINTIKSIGFIPDAIIPSTVALAAFASQATRKRSIIVIDISSDQTTCILIKEGKVFSSRTISTGSSSFNEAFSENSGGLFLTELSKTVLYLQQQPVFNEPINEVLFVGEGVHTPKLKGYILNAINLKEVKAFIPTTGDTQKAVENYAASIGLTLAENTETTINLIKDSVSSCHSLRFVKKAAYKLLLASFLLTFSCFLASNSIQNKEERKLKKAYSKLLSTAGYTVETFEREYSKETTQKIRPFLLKTLSFKQLRSRISILCKQNTPATVNFPLFPNVPRVSDTLAWLCEYQKNTLSPGSEGYIHPININQIKYVMLSRPQKEKSREKYRVKLDVEFTVDSPRTAREFHDALLEKNAFVDAKQGVKWSSQNGHYHASLYLNDKTKYLQGTAKKG